jgi:hypothetical protein
LTIRNRNTYLYKVLIFNISGEVVLKGAVLKKSNLIQKENDLFQLITNYILDPVKFGLVGFSLAFTLLIIVKTFSYLLKYDLIFSVDVKDVNLSLFGFLIVFLVRFLQNFKVTRKD